MVEISIWLFGKPAWEMDIEGQEITSGVMFEEKAKELYDRLVEVSVVVEKLLTKEWSISGALYDLYARKDISEEEAKKELKSLDLNPDDFTFMEFEDEELE